jgi:hypothetical protein
MTMRYIIDKYLDDNTCWYMLNPDPWTSSHEQIYCYSDFAQELEGAQQKIF